MDSSRKDLTKELDLYLEEAVTFVMKALSSRPWDKVVPLVFVAEENRKSKVTLNRVYLPVFYSEKNDKKLNEALLVAGKDYYSRYHSQAPEDDATAPVAFFYAYLASHIKMKYKALGVTVVGVAVKIDAVNLAILNVEAKGDYMQVKDILVDKAYETQESVAIIQQLPVYYFIEGFMAELSKKQK